MILFKLIFISLSLIHNILDKLYFAMVKLRNLSEGRKLLWVRCYLIYAMVELETDDYSCIFVQLCIIDGYNWSTNPFLVCACCSCKSHHWVSLSFYSIQMLFILIIIYFSMITMITFLNVITIHYYLCYVYWLRCLII